MFGFSRGMGRFKIKMTHLCIKLTRFNTKTSCLDIKMLDFVLGLIYVDLKITHLGIRMGRLAIKIICFVVNT